MSSSSASSSSAGSPPPSLKRKRKQEITQSDDEDLDDADTKVVSHAERRRQKKKEKLQGLDESSTKKQKLKDGTAAPTVPGKRQNSVWVGNMSFKTTPENLRTFFEGVGEITRINMPTKAPPGPGMMPENRGFAYVDFSTAEAKMVAISRSEQPLVGRKLLIKDGGDFAGRPAIPGMDALTTGDGDEPPKTHSKTAQKILRAQKQRPAPTLFFGNLGFETTDQAIRELLELHRPMKKKSKSKFEVDETKDKAKDVWIRKVRMGTFEDTGLCKGFAFVDFMTIEHATSALINPKNHQLNGRKLVVEYAGADAVRRGAPKAKREEGAVQRRREPQSRDHRSERPERRQHHDSSWPKSKVDQPGDQSPANDPQFVEKQAAEESERTRPTSGTAQNSGRGKGPRVRPKPGAALALAKRESAAILPSKAQKITF